MKNRKVYTMIINYSESDTQLKVTYNRTDYYEGSATLDFKSDAMNNAHWDINGYDYGSFSLYTKDLDAIEFAKSLMEYTDKPMCTFDDEKVGYLIELSDKDGSHLEVTIYSEPNELVYGSDPIDGESNLSIA